jgi:hypothetical protein
MEWQGTIKSDLDKIKTAVAQTLAEATGDERITSEQFTLTIEKDPANRLRLHSLAPNKERLQGMPWRLEEAQEVIEAFKQHLSDQTGVDLPEPDPEKGDFVYFGDQFEFRDARTLLASLNLFRDQYELTVLTPQDYLPQQSGATR